MKSAIVLTIKVIGALLALIIISCLFYVGFYEWRQTLQYKDRITIKAYYMQYACGDCSIDMKVKSVDNPKYNFIIGHDIFPKPVTKKKEEELCDYVSDKCYSSPSRDCTFELTGYLHKHAHGIPLFDCSETPYFTIEKIRFGSNDSWKRF